MSFAYNSLTFVKNQYKMHSKKAPWYFLFLLIIAGEAVFVLPFVLARVFRPTVLDVFNLDNLQLGICFSVYGIVALFSYVFGGPLADKYPPRKLIAISLWTTSLGGICYATFPDYNTLKVLYGYWGFTTIFLFWAPMIKAARIWGGTRSQGKAFGFLDGGRGLVGALFGSIGLLVFVWMIPSQIETLDTNASRVAFRKVILASASLVGIIGLLVWNFLKLKSKNTATVLEKIDILQIRTVLRLPSVWLLMLIILCAYVCYKITDVFSLYAKDVMGYNQIEAAQIGTLLLFMRPIIGVVIGLFADRFQLVKSLIVGFVISLLGALLFATGMITDASTSLFFISIAIVATGVYAIRSLYFAVMENGQIPIVLTGTAVGLISLIGFTPDIFAGPFIGIMLENNPGIVGHQHVFWMLVGFSFVGGIVSVLYYWMFGRSTKNNTRINN